MQDKTYMRGLLKEIENERTGNDGREIVCLACSHFEALPALPPRTFSLMHMCCWYVVCVLYVFAFLFISILDPSMRAECCASLSSPLCAFSCLSCVLSCV